MSPPPGPGRIPLERLQLEFPRSLAVFDAYEDAQKAVDYLSDKEFAVENVLIVGTDLKQVERVTGRLTTGKVLAGGALSGMWLGLMVGLLLSAFVPNASWSTVLSSVLAGAFFFVIWAGLGYAMTRGKRDFTSVRQVVATRYEVLVEHRGYAAARDLLAGMPGGTGALTATAAAPGGDAGSSAWTGTPPPPARPNPYEGRYGQRLDGAAPAEPADEPAGEASGPPPPTGPRRNPYEGRYGETLEPGQQPPPAEPGSGPADPRP